MVIGGNLTGALPVSKHEVRSHLPDSLFFRLVDDALVDYPATLEAHEFNSVR